MLALVFVLTSFAACAGKGDGDGTATTTGNSELSPMDFVLKSSSGTVCKIYYPSEFVDTPYFSTLTALSAIIEAKIGAKPTMLLADEYVDDGTPAILVCNTGLDVSSSFMRDLKYSDYGFAAAGKDLCIGAHTNSNFSKAVNSLTSVINGLAEADGAYSVPLDKYVVKRGNYSPATINGTDIANFSIVYETEAQREYAESLANEIGVRSGAVLPLSIASEATASEYEILIGNVGRDLTNSIYSELDNNSEYLVKISDKTVAIGAKFDLGIKSAVKALSDKIVKQVSSDKKIEFTNDSSFNGSFYENAELALKARPEGTDIRIGGNNIYFHQTNQNEKIDVRDDFLYTSFEYMDADILLLQEVSPLWHKTMDETMRTRLGYTLVPTSNEVTPSALEKGNYTPIWYRANKLELLDYGHKQYESVKLEPDDYLSMSKSYTWALFKDKATGKQIITVTTHFTWAPENFNPTPNELKKADAREVVALVNQLETEYAGIPIILMGDLNCTSQSDPYVILTEKFTAVNNFAEATNGTNKGTTHSVASTSIGGSIIDHTLFTGDALNFKMYQHVYNKWSFNSTDHIPLILDVQFK